MVVEVIRVCVIACGCNWIRRWLTSSSLSLSHWWPRGGGGVLCEVMHCLVFTTLDDVFSPCQHISASRSDPSNICSQVRLAFFSGCENSWLLMPKKTCYTRLHFEVADLIGQWQLKKLFFFSPATFYKPTSWGKPVQHFVFCPIAQQNRDGLARDSRTHPGHACDISLIGILSRHFKVVTCSPAFVDLKAIC